MEDRQHCEHRAVAGEHLQAAHANAADKPVVLQCGLDVLPTDVAPEKCLPIDAAAYVQAVDAFVSNRCSTSDRSKSEDHAKLFAQRVCCSDH